MRSRFILTLLWLLFFLACIFLIESYIHSKTSTGIFYLLPEDRMDGMKPLLILYGSYLTGILTFWYLRPFKSAPTDEADKFRFMLAVICTVIFNGYILLMVGQSYFSPTNIDILQDVDTATSLAKWFSFIVAPVNVYYFGMKPKE